MTTKAEQDVIAERRRQVEQEGWTAQHDDDEHYDRALARAALSYTTHYVERAWIADEAAAGNDVGARYDADESPDEWPWEDQWWKPKTPRKDLVRAAALLLAEIERVDREEANHGEPG